jgi:LDH2 family malate/lactate/ureidoglycolate dehydrogenase
MTTKIENVNEILARRLTAAGLDADDASEACQAAVSAFASGVDAVMPSLQNDPHGLRVFAECLRSYADVAEAHALARES